MVKIYLTISTKLSEIESSIITSYFRTFGTEKYWVLMIPSHIFQRDNETRATVSYISKFRNLYNS